MPTWRCPHCGTPQAEASRCWVCRRSRTSCATCCHFGHAVVGQIGYCGLDRRRRPLAGDEIRPCWSARIDLVANAVSVGPAPAPRPLGPRAPVPVVAGDDWKLREPVPIALTDPADRLWVDAE